MSALGDERSCTVSTSGWRTRASPVVNASAVVTVVLGGVVLGEDDFRVRLFAAGLAVTGVTLIGIG